MIKTILGRAGRAGRAGLAGIVVAMVSACGGSDYHPPSITTQPQGQSVTTDTAATFSVTASGPDLRYQWKRNGGAILGATSASYTTPAATYTDSGAQYTVDVSNVDGAVTSAAAQLTLALSANQKAFEDLILGPNGASYGLHWSLGASTTQVSGTNYLWSDSGVVAQSPLVNGPQTNTQSAAVNMASTLPLVAAAPTRILKDGVVLVVPGSQPSVRASYVGNDVQVDSFAADNTTVASSQIRTDFSTVPLSGVLAGTTDDFAHYHNSIFNNPAILKATAVYGTGANYVKYTAINKGDRYTAFDCHATTTDANVSPCLTGTTLTAALTTGIASSSDATTYHLADGVVSTIAGVPVWVATAARPLSTTLSTTQDYRFYFQLNGNVYTGALVKDGSVLGGGSYVSNPAGATVVDRLTFLPFIVRMNKAARDSIAAAVTI